MKKSRYGFTLIELLVVIAIIAILAAILFPVFAKAREKARQTSCLSDEKQIGLGMLQYVQDYDEKYPGWHYSDGGTNHGAGWLPGTMTYMKSNGLVKCPDDATTPTKTGYTTLSYAMNTNVTDIAKSSQAALTTVAKTVLLFEATNKTVDPTLSVDNNGGTPQDCGPGGVGFGKDGTGKWAGGTWYYATGTMGGIAATANGGSNQDFNNQLTGRHTDGSNFLFADGHAKWYRGAGVSPGASAYTSTDAQGANTYTLGDGPVPTAAGVDNTTYSATFSTI